MQCENGYTKDGVRGILCRAAGELQDGDLKATAHALCGHQRFCPNQHCFSLLPGWEKCTRRGGGMTTPQSATPTAPLAQGSQEREEAAGSEIAASADKSASKKKSRKKGTQGE